MSQPKPPSPPDPGQTYAQGIQTFLQYLPQMLQKEYKYRGIYDPKYIEQQQGLQDTYGPKQYEQELSALNQLNPYFSQVYGALGNNVLQGFDPNNPYIKQANQLSSQASGLATQTANEASLGTRLDPAFQQQLESEIRGAQAARGNTLGNAGISGEVLYQGRAGQELYNQRLQRALQAGNYAESAGQYAAGQRQVPLANAGMFLGTTSPVQQVQQISPVSAPDQFRLVNPNAGYLGQQIGQQGYQNALAAYGLQGNSGQGWGSTIGGALGTAVGAYYGGFQGAQLGGTTGSYLGGQVGSYFSDARIKENITYTGQQTRFGIPLVEFNYIKDPKKRYRGVIAQDVLKVRPDAVFHHRGVLGVNYDAIGATLEAI